MTLSERILFLILLGPRQLLLDTGIEQELVFVFVTEGKLETSRRFRPTGQFRLVDLKMGIIKKG